MRRKKSELPFRFGTAGLPHGSSDIFDGIERLAKMGLDHMEIEFVRSIFLDVEKAAKVGKTARENGISLSVHAPYWINLNAHEDEKLVKSRNYILDAARVAQAAGAGPVVFHAAFMMKDAAGDVYARVFDELRNLRRMLDERGVRVELAPEITGKPSAFGDPESLLTISKAVKGIRPCLDLAHFVARTGGATNDPAAFAGLLDEYAVRLGKSALRSLHIHMEGIEWTAKGERRHVNFGESEFRCAEFLAVLREKKAGGTIVCESPNLEKDALLLKKTFSRL